VDPAQITQLVSCCYSLLSPELLSLGLPDFPADSLPAAVKLMVCEVKVVFIITVKYFIYYNSKLLKITLHDFVLDLQQELHMILLLGCNVFIRVLNSVLELYQ
jgi:hypothetical protein